jgi:hypothetical protein
MDGYFFTAILNVKLIYDCKMKNYQSSPFISRDDSVNLLSEITFYCSSIKERAAALTGSFLSFHS